MTLARKLRLVGLILIAPLLVSGVLEVFDFKCRIATRTHCYWPEVELGVQRTADGFVLTEDQHDERTVAVLMFDSLSTRYHDERVICATNYVRIRRLRLVPYGQDDIRMSESEMQQIRAKLQQYLTEHGADSRLIEEAALPDVHIRGIHWAGVYWNGVALLAFIGIPLSLLAIPAYQLSPHARGKRRLAEGHCPDCDYDLRSGIEAGCPECGWRRNT